MYNQPWQYQMFPQVQTPMPLPTQTIRSGLVGRMINSVNEMTPSDVPMDGTLGVFPLQDGSAIYTKRWQSDGKIEQIEYRPTHEQRPRYTPIEEELLSRVEALESRFTNKEADCGRPHYGTDDAEKQPTYHERSDKISDGERYHERGQQDWRADSPQSVR